MRKLIFYIFMCVAVAALLHSFFSCNPDIDADDNYPYTAILFVYQDYNRNIIVGEGLKIGVGVTLSGLINNKEERTVTLAVEPELVTIPGKTVLPPDYYTIANNAKIIIPKGKHDGYVSVLIDSAKFLADAKALTGEYVLPLRIASVQTVDTIKPEKSFIRISLSYYAKQFGYYYYSGYCDKIMDGVTYNSNSYKNISTDTDSRRYLETVGPTAFRIVADAKNTNDPARNIRFRINVPTRGTDVTIQSEPNSPYEVRSTGPCSYDPLKRSFHLEYTWTEDDGTVCLVKENLTFRNRIYDNQGNNIYVNEWQGDF